MNRVLLILKSFGISQKNYALLKICAALVLGALLTMGIYFVSYSDDVNKGLADNLIRLHVIANSDSPEDQALKSDVRDAIIDYMKDKLKDSRDIEETKYIIKENMDAVAKISEDEIARGGKDYPVKIMLGAYPFPTKSYGDVTLPAGYYEALKVVIGKGEGANWWCVLFPPLCFVDATHGTVPDSVKEDLKNALTDEEYDIIVSASNDDDIPVKIKFKVVEFFQSSRIKFSGFINRIFRLGN
jgi:stage II sporulation protein R